MPYLIALVLLAIFVGNVVLGAMGNPNALGNVSELLLLIGASIAFSVGILRSEAREKAAGANSSNTE